MVHSSGITVDIVDIRAGDRGRFCEKHDVYGVVVQLDTVSCFRKVQIDINGSKQTAIMAV